MSTLSVTVYGLPAPQGSKRHIGRGILIEDNPRTKTWREDVKLAALRALDAHPEWDVEAATVVATVIFTFPRPKKHYRTGLRSHELREDAPLLHAGKPDLDKLLRATGDALTAAGVYRDDCRLAQVWASKTYALHPGQRSPGTLDRPGAQIHLSAVSYRVPVREP